MTTRFTSSILTVVALAALLYLLGCAYLYWTQERLLFYPTRLDPTYAYDFALPFDEYNLEVEGATLNVVRFRAAASSALTDDTSAGEPKGVVLYLHGNGDLILYLEETASFFVDLGYDVVIPNYRGYGKSTGHIDGEAALLADVAAVYDFVRDDYINRYGRANITLYGQSLGTGLAVALAASNAPQRLILESPYLSMKSMVRIHMPLVPAFLLRYPLRSDQWITEVTCPVYILHGARDRLIPIEQGERLYALIESEKHILRLPNAGHNALLRHDRARALLRQIL